MLTILGNARSGRFCDGLSRRSFLKIGGLLPVGSALGGLSLTDVLRAESDAAGGRSTSSH